MEVLGKLRGESCVVHHGVNKTFEQAPRAQRALESYSKDNPFRLLYVSIVTVYKHQANVVKTVVDLRAKGVPVHLDLVGSAYPPALKKFQRILHELDPSGDAVTYHGPVSYSELYHVYHEADAFVFASSCETFGQIVTEAMSAGLPIACSDTGTMKELLGQNAIYFDPEKPSEISIALMRLLSDSSMRVRFATRAFEFSKSLSWERCAFETFDFIAQVAAAHGARQRRMANMESL
jgi:glycosyltransferase involved in cell wall biosynthesis